MAQSILINQIWKIYAATFFLNKFKSKNSGPQIHVKYSKTKQV